MKVDSIWVKEEVPLPGPGHELAKRIGGRPQHAFITLTKVAEGVEVMAGTQGGVVPWGNLLWVAYSKDVTPPPAPRR